MIRSVFSFAERTGFGSAGDCSTASGSCSERNEWMKDEKPAPNGKGMEKYEKNGRLERIEWQPAWPHLLGDLRGTAWVYIMQGTQMGSLLPGSEWTTQTLMMPVLGVKRR